MCPGSACDGVMLWVVLSSSIMPLGLLLVFSHRIAMQEQV